MSICFPSGLNVGEAVIVGEITKVPVMVKVRPRLTREGGADIDILAKLRQAREEVRLREEIRKDRERVLPRKDTMFSEV